MKKILYTQEGYEKLLAEKKELDEKRVVAVKELSVARDMGDRSENAAYKYGRQKLSAIDRQMRFINTQLRFAEVIQAPKDGYIDIGSKVVVDDGKQKKEFTVVGGYESDLQNGRISCYSPLGKVLRGKKVNDTVQFTAPIGQISYKILQIV